MKNKGQGLIEYLLILALMLIVVMSIADLLNPDPPAEPKNEISLMVAYTDSNYPESF